jgi:hypothetical protein
MAKRLGTFRRFDTFVPPTVSDRLTRLSVLWQAFERSGSISAYITYRLHLSRLIRVEPESRPPTTASPS